MNDKTIAKSLSVLFHPILYPTYGFLLLFYIDNLFIVKINDQVKLYILSVVFLNTLILPMLIIWFFKKQGIIRSVVLENRTERFYPLLFGLLFYLSTWALISRLQLSALYNYILVLAVVLSVMALAINFFFKISLHSMGAASFSTALLLFSYIYNIQLTSIIVVVFLLTGLVSSSRLILKAHHPWQVYSGLIVGALASLLSLIFVN